MSEFQEEKAVASTIPVEGMTCASCVARIEKAVGRIPEVESVSVNLATESAHLILKTSGALQSVIAAIEQLGYTVPKEKTQEKSPSTDPKDKALQNEKFSLGLAVLLTLPLVVS